MATGLTISSSYARLTGKTAAQGNVASYTLGSSDGSFVISSNILVTASNTHAFTGICTYHDEVNGLRTQILNYSNLAGTISPNIANAGGTGDYNGIPLHIRCKSGSAIILGTTGLFTSVTYNVEGIIRQIA